MRPTPLRVLFSLIGYHSSATNLVKGVAIDSRLVQPGDLFFALPGNRVDGHAFLHEAASKGAVGAVVAEGFKGEHGSFPLFPVPDVLQTLQDLARAYLARSQSQVIALTGSLGKTTTKGFLATLLESHYKVFATPKSYNSQATLPLSILMSEGDEDYLLLEMGMTHPGQIEKLVSIAPPTLALITTVAVQHASNFSDGLEGISREKGSVLAHPKTLKGLVHKDIDHFEEVTKIGSCDKQTFSTSSCEADFFLKTTPEGLSFYEKGEKVCEIALQFPLPVYNHNFLCAAAASRLVGLPWSAIQEAAPLLRLPPMRFERVEKEGILFINDAFNANPDAMKVALENLPPPLQGGKRVAVLGEMDALGIYSEAGHTLVAESALQHVDYLLCLGKRCEGMRQIWERAGKPVALFESRSELEKTLKKLLQPGDVVLLKGARAHALDQVLNSYS